MSIDAISSPAASGGAGNIFERHVDAYWLAQLLVKAIPPILHDCGVVEVHFQTEHLGWSTDDFLVVGENASGIRRKLAGQVKRTFTVSSTDEECKKTVLDFWKDFQKSQQFTLADDRFALVTLRGTNTLLEHFSGLLDCSRAAHDGQEFERRLTTRGFLSAKAGHYCDELLTIIGEIEKRNVRAAEVWPFLRVLHVLSLDLTTATRQTEAMIKTLLAYTASEQDAIAAANASWNALLREVDEAVPTARSFRRNDLPAALQQLHSPVGGTEQRVLRALADHSTPIMKGIRSTIDGDLHLNRGRLILQVIEQLESTQIVLVSGAAGCGKSGIAKDAIEVLGKDHFTFCFRAEEFACSHLDDTLQKSQIPAGTAMLGAILATQGRKVLLIESVERLLEASTRDAFTDLLLLVASDKSWRVVLTCRDYSTDLVRSCFLDSAKVGHSLIAVPLLDDEELKAVETGKPILQRPLADPALRRLLRNIYFLDKAMQIEWGLERPLPQSEREFRALFWKEIVRADQRAASGMPRRREHAFLQIALRRARALTVYANCSDLEADVVDVLRHDSLVVSSQQNPLLIAPAHDVLEDLAILQWIDGQYATLEGSSEKLSAEIGTHPAVRRTYRKWVSELVERDAPAADRLFESAVLKTTLSAQFRDDTFVSLLRSPSSASFLERHSAELFANDKELLRRMIHLLRVACVTTPPWLNSSGAHASLYNVPDGVAWACVLRLMQGNLALFAAADCPLILGFVEDWARGISWQSPYPDGANSVAQIAHWLLTHFHEYKWDSQRKRTLQVIAKIPNGDRKSFANLLKVPGQGEKQDRAGKDFREIILTGLDGTPAARDMPKAIVAAANNYLLCSDADLKGTFVYRGGMEIESLFGIKPSRSHDYFPASAYRGPWILLLRNHPRIGLDFVIKVFNHSADWYAHPRLYMEFVELPFEIKLTFRDGASRMQWCNSRLWLLYRGMSVGPYVLQSLLMALEQWLLEFARARPQELDEVLVEILQRSDSGALTAVVASVGTAFPHASGEALLVILSSPLCILLDRQRFAQESQAPSKMLAMMPQLNAKNGIYDDERKDADVLSHRRHDLEMAIANLQLGPLSSRVHEILDRHRAETQLVKEQGEEERIWRLALHRMDLRQYTVADGASNSAPVPADSSPAERDETHIQLELKVPEPDIKEMVDQSAMQLKAMNARLSLEVWGFKVYRREESKLYDSGQWRQRIKEARSELVRTGGSDTHDLGDAGPGFVASVCVRDHWEEMAEDDQNWCLNVVCSEVERTGSRWNRQARVQLHSSSADRPCASVLPLLIAKSRGTSHQARVEQAFVIALTHSVDEVRLHAALGIGKHLWKIDRELTLRCVHALALEASLVQRASDEETKRRFGDPDLFDKIEGDTAALIRRQFFEAGGISTDAYEALDTSRWFGVEANERILTILAFVPDEPFAISAFERLSQTLVAWWNADDEHDEDGRTQRVERNHHIEPRLTNILEQFLLNTSIAAATVILQPVLAAVDRHPREIKWMLIGLIGIEDQQSNTPQFWSLWELFAESVRHAKWLARIDDKHSRGDEVISAIFLGTWWKEDTRHWGSLEGNAQRIHKLYESLPISSCILDHYVRFLYHVGERSLPGAFIGITRKLNATIVLKANTIFMLEVLLQRHVYSKPLELKRNPELREAVLQLLDVLIDQGSSAAFRMRDDFVTPLAAT